jgi:hypothetical protein
MAAHELVFPRLVYRGAGDDTAETLTVENADALDVAMKAGYRLQRVDKKHPVPDEPAATIDVPAQPLKIGKK